MAEKLKKIFHRISDIAKIGLQKLYPSCSICVGDKENFFVDYYNCGKESLFDIASLTKPIAGSSIILSLDILYQKIADVLPPPETDEDEKKKIEVIDILEHKGGFRAHLPLFEGETPGKNTREKIMKKAWNAPLQNKPKEKTIYSDIGFICLTYFVENFTSKRVDELFNQIRSEIGMQNTFFFENIPENRKKDVIPTSDNFRVHDENSFFMNGVSLHAGLFSNVEDIAKFCIYIIQERKEDLKEVGGKEYLLGFDIFRTNSKVLLGHLGFTGCGFWIDIKKETYAIFLTNRVYPSVGRYPSKAPEEFLKLRESVWKTLASCE